MARFSDGWKSLVGGRWRLNRGYLGSVQETPEAQKEIAKRKEDEPFGSSSSLARARNGNRTRTAITGQGIFLLLLLSHKPSQRDVVVWTISSPCHGSGLGVAYIVSTPFISFRAEFSEPSPHLSSPTERFLFVRAILLHRFPDEHSCFKSLVSTNSTIWAALQVQFANCECKGTIKSEKWKVKREKLFSNLDSLIKSYVKIYIQSTRYPLAILILLLLTLFVSAGSKKKVWKIYKQIWVRHAFAFVIQFVIVHAIALVAYVAHV